MDGGKRVRGPLTYAEEILADLEARGVRFKLIDGVFRYQDCNGALRDWEHEHLDSVRSGMTEVLRLKRGLCLACTGSPRPATRPSPWGYADRPGTRGGNTRVMVSKHLRLPLKWCEECWESGHALRYMASNF